jgi:acetyl esterase/lipase
MVVAELLLARIALVTRRTRVLVTDALADLEPGPDAPRFPRSHVVLPILLNHRRGVGHVRNVKFRRAGGKQLRLDVTVPTAPVPGGGALRPALLQIHGGGWVIGDKREQGIPLLNHMATQGWVGFNVNYRLSPWATIPEQIEDLTRGGAFGADDQVYDLFLQSWVMKAFVDEEPEKYAAASPLHRVHADAPPFLVVHGDRDTLAPVQDARAFVARLREVSKQPVAYAEMQGAQHAFEVFPSARTARVIEGVERFLSTLWERRDASTTRTEAQLADVLTD